MGWARANVLYELLDKPPKPGTPLESLILMVWQMREMIRLRETRAITQAILSAGSEREEMHKAAMDAWDNFVDEFMPYQRGKRKRQDHTAVNFLKEEVARGPLRVVPLVQLGKPRSRLKSKEVRRG